MKRRNFLKAALATSLLTLLPTFLKTYYIPKDTISIYIPNNVKRFILRDILRGVRVDLDNPESIKIAENILGIEIQTTPYVSGITTVYSDNSLDILIMEKVEEK